MYRQKMECEFCGRRHNNTYDTCVIRTDEFPDGNNFEKGGRQIKLRDMYAMLKYERNLRFEVMLNKDSNFSAKGLTLNSNLQNFKAAGKNKQVVSLDACFRSFEEQELLTGDDQWYCRKCAEHRDSYKKLDLYMAPKILMVQLKRFQTKKGAQNRGSGFLNMAYA